MYRSNHINLLIYIASSYQNRSTLQQRSYKFSKNTTSSTVPQHQGCRKLCGNTGPPITLFPLISILESAKRTERFIATFKRTFNKHNAEGQEPQGNIQEFPRISRLLFRQTVRHHLSTFHQNHLGLNDQSIRIRWRNNSLEQFEFAPFDQIQPNIGDSE